MQTELRGDIFEGKILSKIPSMPISFGSQIITLKFFEADDV